MFNLTDKTFEPSLCSNCMKTKHFYNNRFFFSHSIKISLSLPQCDQTGLLMCKQGLSWIHAAVLTLKPSISNSSSNTSSSNSTASSRSLRQDIQTFTKTSSFASLLRDVVGSFPPKVTSPTAPPNSTTTTQAGSNGSQVSSSLSLTLSIPFLSLAAFQIFLQGIN